MPEWLGKTIGRVRIEKLLAQGGMAEVYLGTHLTLERPVAIKFLHSHIEEEPLLLERFHREARVVAGLRHPNIVQVFDFDTVDGHPFIVMEYFKGPTLAAYLRNLHQRKKRLPPNQVAHLLDGLTSALDYAHEQGVIHRDIKPGNILLHNNIDEIPLDQALADDVEPILTDFGLVRVMDAATQTASGIISGTAAYMSPEQARGTEIDQRTDIYSVGVVLYEMLAGHVPFEADNTVTVLHMHIHTPPPPIPGSSPGVQAVVDRALAKSPKDRYQTSREMADAFAHSIGMTDQAKINDKPIPSTSLPTVPPLSTKPEAEPGLQLRKGPDPLPKSQQQVKSVPLAKSNPQIESVPAPKRTRGLMWVGAAIFGLVFLALLTYGATRLFSGKAFSPKPTEVLNTSVPAATVSSLPAETPGLPSADEMVQVPADTYEVGTTSFTDDYHIPPKRISLEGFWIDQYLITNAKYQQYMAETGAPQPLTWPGTEDHPVLGVTWEQALAYCQWENKHLATEAQWEAAGRGPGPSPRIYPWGDESTAGGQALTLPDDDPYAVGSQSFNQSLFGVFDMVGNVWEWVGEPYADEQAGYKILRGGRYGLPINDLSFRLVVAPDDSRYLKYTGFRCAADQVK